MAGREGRKAASAGRGCGVEEAERSLCHLSFLPVGGRRGTMATVTIVLSPVEEIQGGTECCCLSCCEVEVEGCGTAIVLEEDVGVRGLWQCCRLCCCFYGKRRRRKDQFSHPVPPAME